MTGLILGIWLTGLGVSSAQSNGSEPPAGAARFALLSPLGTFGESASWTAPDGSRIWLETTGAGVARTQLRETVRLGRDGMPVSLVVQKHGAPIPVESFVAASDRFRWNGPSDAREGRRSGSAFYVPSAAPSDSAPTSPMNTSAG